MIGLRGIEIKTISIEEKEDGTTVSGMYSLMSTENKVLAKQGFNGYSDIKVEMSSEARKHLNDFLRLFQKDIEIILGLDKKE